MTTLPQNPALRLPRSSPSAQPTPGGPTPSGMTGADVVRVLRGNIILIICSVLIAAVLGYVANIFLARNFSKYTSIGLVKVDAQQSLASLMNRNGGAGNTILMNNDAIQIEQLSQVQLLKDDSLFAEVIRDDQSPIRKTQWFASFGDDIRAAKEDLTKNFNALPINDTKLIRVQMTYSVPDDARVIVQAIVDRHLANQRGESLNDTSVRQGRLTRLQSKIRTDLNAASSERAEIGQRLSAQGVNPGQRVSTKDIEIEAATKGYIEAQTRLGQVRGQLQQLQAAMTEGNDPPMLINIVERDETFIRAQAELRQIDIMLRNAERGGEASPNVRRLRDQRIAMDNSLTELRRELLSKLKATLPESLKSEEVGAEAAMKMALANLDQLKTTSAALLNDQNKYLSLIEREEQLATALREVTETLDQVQVQPGTGAASLEWARLPFTPEIPSFPKLPVTLTVAIVLGLGLALGIAFLREIFDSTIRSPRDVAKVGGITVLGTVQHEGDDPQSAGARLPLVIAEAPQSMTAEQLRQIRTRLQHSASLDSTKSLMVTSGNPGDGKTTVAANLAAGLALVGRKILLVDANFRRPELHKLFGVDNKDGFSNVLTSPDQLAGATKATKIPNLSLLPAGNKPANAAELLESVLLENFITKALETYDHVIFDSGPLLFASESVAMAPRVDGVITVVRANSSSRGVLGRVRDMLKQIKAENLGVVINGIRAHGGGYYSRNIKTYYEYANNNNNG